MVKPYDYSIDVPDPVQAFGESYALGAKFAESQAKREAAQAEAVIKQQQQQAAIRAQQEVDALYTNPNPLAADFARVSSLLPKDQAENVRKGWEILSDEKKQTKLAQSGQVFSALRANAPDIAIKLLEEQAVANRNAGREEEAKAAETYIRIINVDPKRAADNIGTMLAVVPGGERIIESAAKSAEMRRADEMAPITVRKETALSAEAEEKAKQAAIKSRFAESDAVIDLEKKGWDIRKIRSDIDVAKQNAQIAAANVQIGNTTNALKRQELELKIEDMKQKRDSAVREKATEASTAAAQSDNLLNTLETALQKAAKRDKTGKVIGYTRTVESATGPISTMLPTINQDVADFEELINTLRSQVTMSRIAEMKGTLSDKDMAVLESSLQSLSLRQSPQQLVNSLLESQRLTLKARKETVDKFGAPERLAQPDIPAARGAAAPAASGFSVTAPNGQTFTFPTKQAADQFKQAAGIR